MIFMIIRDPCDVYRLDYLVTINNNLSHVYQHLHELNLSSVKQVQLFLDMR